MKGMKQIKQNETKQNTQQEQYQRQLQLTITMNKILNDKSKVQWAQISAIQFIMA